MTLRTVLVHIDVTLNWLLAATSYRITSVLRWDIVARLERNSCRFVLIFWLFKCNIPVQSFSERHVLLNRIFHFSIIMGKAWSIDGGMLGVSLALFVLSTWDKMARLGEIFINEYLVKTHNLNRAEMGALHLYFVILAWNLSLAFAFGRLLSL